jgi:protein arginine kinase activator
MKDAQSDKAPAERRCELCGKSPAEIRLVEIVEGRKSSQLLCRPCAEGKGIVDEPEEETSVEELLSVVSKRQADTQPAACGNCGLTWEAFQQDAALGCSACYEAFATHLRPLLRRMHRHERHAGKLSHAQAAQPAAPRALRELRADLSEAVRVEDYELAAELRDRIRALEESLGPAGADSAGEGDTGTENA